MLAQIYFLASLILIYSIFWLLTLSEVKDQGLKSLRRQSEDRCQLKHHEAFSIDDVQFSELHHLTACYVLHYRINRDAIAKDDVYDTCDEAFDDWREPRDPVESDASHWTVIVSWELDLHWLNLNLESCIRRFSW